MSEEHKRSGKRRRRTDLTAIDRRRSPEESKRLKQRAKQRKRQRVKEARPRERAWDEDELGGVQRMGGGRGAARPQPAAGAEPPPTEADDAGGDAALPVGRVCLPGRTQLRVLVGQRELPARIPPTLAEQEPGWPVVGDRVELVVEGKDRLAVRRVLPRRGVLARAGGAAGGTRVLATHVELGVLVLNAERAAFRPGLVDRGRLALQRGGVDALVVLNKIDRAEPAWRAAMRAELADHLAAEVPLLETSALTGEGLAALRTQVAGRCLVLFGHSGVGKSSLLNALDPEGQRAAAEVRAGDGKGRHTTTAGALRRLPGGTIMIDTPGVRAFALGPVDAEELALLFPDVEERARACRFGDCAHDSEPGCAVRRALDAGELSAARWARYRRLAHEGAKS